MTDCVFCPANWGNLDVVQEVYGTVSLGGRMGKMLIIKPLDPVTEGHVLAIHERHTENLSEDLFVAMETMGAAAAYVRAKGIQANVITSIGPLATQTVMHTHVHIVPRRENDGLPLPWTPQHEEKARREAKRQADARLWP